MARLSIIVTSYNCRKFISTAIESALAVDWPDTEVIVVDDASTDGSISVIEKYQAKLDAILINTKNEGQCSTANTGFARASGDVVIFLDSDDLVFPNVARQVMPFFAREDVSKVQFAQQLVGSDGKEVTVGNGISIAPIFTERNTPDWCRRALEKTGYYATPPTSGNAWNSRCLQQIFPLAVRTSTSRGWNGHFFDAYLSMIMPFLGDVVSIPQALGAYRVHPYSATNSMDFLAALRVFDDFFEDCANKANQFLAKINVSARIDVSRNEAKMRRRIARCKISPDDVSDPRIALALCQYSTAVIRSDLGIRMKLFSLLWAAGVVLAPLPLANHLVMLRFEPKARSTLFKLISRIS